MSEEKQTEWICRICGWSVIADQPPDICPKCGAPKEYFDPIEKFKN